MWLLSRSPQEAPAEQRVVSVLFIATGQAPRNCLLSDESLRRTEDCS